MSRIGKLQIEIPSGVELKLEGTKLNVKGPKGELSIDVHPDMKVIIEENLVKVERPSDHRDHRSLHGLTRSLINNMVEGVTKGYEKKLEILGVGYRANVQGSNLVLTLGFSHPVNYPIPEGIQVLMDPDKKNIIIIQGIDKQKVGQVAAEIRSYRKPEPYKGKGVRYLGEQVKRKAGKSAAAA